MEIERKDKHNGQLQDDVARMRDKADKLLRTIDELQASESSEQLSARRAERELREEREKSLRLERELEGWKNLRMEKAASVVGGSGSVVGSVRGMDSLRRNSLWKTAGEADGGPDGVRVPGRKSSIGRAPSLTKGFL
jgi:myosin protein heavy chain